MANGASTNVTQPVATIAPLPQPNVPITGLSPSALAAQAQLAQEMMKAGIDTSPVRSWTQGMARVANAVFGGQMMRDAYQREMDLYNKGASDAARLVGGGGGGGAGGDAARIASVTMNADQGSRGGGAGAAATGNPVMDALIQAESGGRNIPSEVDPDVAGPGTRSQGYFQIDTPTWRDYGAKAGVDLSKYPNAMSAPLEVQTQVASAIPITRFGKRTRDILHGKFGQFDEHTTVGALSGGGSGGGSAIAANVPSPAASPMAMKTLSGGGDFVIPPADQGAASTTASPDGAGGAPPELVLTSQPKPPGDDLVEIDVNGRKVWGTKDGEAVTASGAKVKPDAAAGPKGGDETAPGAGGLPPSMADYLRGGTMPWPGSPALTTLPPGVAANPPLPPVRPAVLGGAGVPLPPPRPANLGQPPAGAIPPNATALAPPQPAPSGAALYQGRTRLDLPGTPSAAPLMAAGANLPAAGARPMAATAPPSVFAGGPLAFLGNIGNAMGGIFGGGSQAPQLTPGGGQVAQAITGGQAQQGQPASGYAAPGGAPSAGGQGAGFSPQELSILMNPWAPDWAKQYVLQLVNRRTQSGLPGEWKEKARYDPNTGQWLPGFVNPYTGAVTIPEGTAGAAPAPSGAAPAGGAGGQAAAPPDELGLSDDQKKTWGDIMSQPSGAAIPPRPQGWTIPDWSKYVRERADKEGDALRDEALKSTEYGQLHSATSAYNSMVASAYEHDPQAAFNMRTALGQIIKGGPRSISADEIKAANEGVGVPAERFAEIEAWFKNGHAPLSAEGKRIMLKVALGRITAYRQSYGDTELGIARRMHGFGIDPTQYIPGVPNVNRVEDGRVVDSLGEELPKGAENYPVVTGDDDPVYKNLEPGKPYVWIDPEGNPHVKTKAKPKGGQ